MSSTIDSTGLTNPATVTALLAQVLADGPHPQPPPALTYLRRKAGRGLVAVYGNAVDCDRLYTVTVDERALMPTSGNESASAAEPHWQGNWPGLLADPLLGLAVQAFPTDRALPALAAAIKPATHPQLWAALQSAGSASLPAGTSWTLHSAKTEPVRYKPGDRCVLRYRLHFSGPGSTGTEQAQAAVIGKLYREPAQAAAAEQLLVRLRQSPARNWCPAPVGRIDSLALLLSEDLGDRHSDPPTRPGTDVLCPSGPDSAGTIAAAGRALADLHTIADLPPGTPLRSGAEEAIKAGKRAQVLSEYLPSLAAETARISGAVCDRLRAAEPDRYLPAHGSYKPSQLLVRHGSVFLVDFDQFCKADPALDVGYFVAYLRPPGLLYDRPGTRAWFGIAAQTFRSAYRDAMLERGAAAPETDSTLSRSAVYEAALLLKIAARRPNRLHSPRAGEVSALLREIAECLRTEQSG